MLQYIQIYRFNAEMTLRVKLLNCGILGIKYTELGIRSNENPAVDDCRIYLISLEN